MIIQNMDKLLVFHLEDLTFQLLEAVPSSLKGALLIHPDENHLLFYHDRKKYTYVADTLTFEVEAA